MPAPKPRSRHGANYADDTWIEPEEFASARNTFTRRAYVELAPNSHNPIALPYGTRRVVLARVADTVFTAPARLRYRGRTIVGFISMASDREIWTFTPEADPEACRICALGNGCRRIV